jgi:hypothetical protein
MLRHGALRILVFALAIGAAAASDSRLLFADDVDDVLATMKEAEKDGDDPKFKSKAESLKDSSDPRVSAAMKSYAQHSKNDEVAIFAMKWLAGRGDLDIAKWLIAKVDDKDLRDKKDGRPKLYCGILDTLLLYRKGHPEVIKAGLGKVEDVIKKDLSTNSEYATREVRLYGVVQIPVVVDTLIQWGEQLDSRTGKGGGAGGNRKSTSQETREIETASRQAIIETLNEMTGQEIADVETWKKWWTDNKKTFKFPDRAVMGDPGGSAQPREDPSGLTEFVDPGYGFTIKRPTSAGWIFALAPEKLTDCRVILRWAPPEDANFVQARAMVFVWNTKKPGPKDLKDFAKWEIENVFNKEMTFPEEKKNPIETLVTKLSGMDCTILKAKGDGAGDSQGWGGLERRCYMVKIEHNILYIDCLVRLGAEQSVKDELWSCIEGVTFGAPPKK